MANATKSKKRISKALGQANADRFSVEYGNVSIGEDTASIGIRIPRKIMNIMAADGMFCGRRLLGSIVVHAGDEDPDQKHLGDVRVAETIRGSFDVKRFGVSPKYITARLAFAISEIEVGDLAKFSKQTGSLIVEQSIGLDHVPTPEDDEESEE